MRIIYTVICLMIGSMVSSQTLYWVGKTGGDFGDISNWSDQSGGSGGVALPDPSIHVVFDKNSGLEPGENVIFSAGVDYHAKSITVVREVGDFTFLFLGTNSNRTTLSIYGNLIIENNLVTSFVDPGSFKNKIIFNGSSVTHFIVLNGQDLNHVEFLNPNAQYVQETNLYASSEIRMYGGEWFTQGFEVRTDGVLRFQDNQGSSSPFSKEFSTDGSDIFCKEYFARLAYGSLDISGSHTIFVEIFDGNPAQPNVPSNYDEIVLLNYEPGTFLPIEDNNLECAGCFFQKVTIADNFVTRIAGGLSIQNLIINNIQSKVQVNGGNGRDEFISLGTVSSPPAEQCNVMPSISAIYSPGVALNALNSTLTLSNMRLTNASAGAVGNYVLQSGILSGNSKGWNIVNPIPSNTFYWRNATGNNLWDDWRNWENDFKINGCIPTEVDDVIIDNDAPGNIHLPSLERAVCRDLKWNKLNSALNMQINNGLDIYGNMRVSKVATFSGSGSIDMVGVGQFEIESDAILPRVDFRSVGSLFFLEANLKCEELYFSGATFVTNNFDIETNEWSVDNVDGNNFYLGSSEIKVAGAVNLAANNGVEQILDAGISTIICEDFKSRKSYDFYNLTLKNPFTFTFENFPFTFNTLKLEGTAPVRIIGDMELNQLQLTDGNSDLQISPGKELTVNNIISSVAQSTLPASIKSTSTVSPALITKPSGNFCIDGFMEIEDITASSSGVVHAPEATDLGGNSHIDFTSINFSSSIPLHWVGKTTNWAIRSNWSTISGGCSTNFNPNNRDLLIFDQHSFYNHLTVELQAATVTNNILFDGVSTKIDFDAQVSLSLDNMELKNSSVKLIGQNYIVNQETKLEGSLLEMENNSFQTLLLNVVNNNVLLVLRNGTLMRVGN